MIDVIFPRRSSTPRERERERDACPGPGDYRPKPLGPVGAEDEAYFSGEPADTRIDLHRLEDEIARNRLGEIATLVRALTYGEMMDLAQAIWNIRPEGAINQQSLPMMLHLWSTATEADAAAAKAVDAAEAAQ